MTTTPTPTALTALSVVVTDMGRSLAFYRTCGLDLPADTDAEPHVEGSAAGGFKVMFDTVDVVASFDPAWAPPTGGHRMALAFSCGSPAEVDAIHQRLAEAGNTSHLTPFDAVWSQRYAVGTPAASIPVVGASQPGGPPEPDSRCTASCSSTAPGCRAE
ncbi:MAG: VOC family protein [Actinomycetota bacterium]|nr:VOC family protein [Actinomycetota bacterium]